MNIKQIPFGSLEAFNVLVEVSEGSKVKYEYDHVQEVFKVDFIARNNFSWPFNYGEIFGTQGGDGDKLDAIVLSSQPLAMGSVVLCRAIGMVEIVDRGEEDNKIMCIPATDSEVAHIQDLDNLSEEQLRAYEDFFTELAVQKNKIMEVKGFHGAEQARMEIKKSLE